MILVMTDLLGDRLPLDLGGGKSLQFSDWKEDVSPAGRLVLCTLGFVEVPAAKDIDRSHLWPWLKRSARRQAVSVE